MSYKNKFGKTKETKSKQVFLPEITAPRTINISNPISGKHSTRAVSKDSYKNGTVSWCSSHAKSSAYLARLRDLSLASSASSGEATVTSSEAPFPHMKALQWKLGS